MLLVSLPRSERVPPLIFRLSVFQLVQLGPQPLAKGGSPRSESSLAGPGQMLRPVAPVQDAHRVRPMQVDELLLPIRAVHHRTYGPSPLRARRWVSIVASRAKLRWSIIREK